METLIVKAMPLPHIKMASILDDFKNRAEEFGETSLPGMLAILETILNEFDKQNQKGVLRYKVVTPADIESARVFYTENMEKPVPLQLTVEKWRKKHTKGQRGLLHAIIGKIARETGMSKNKIKDGIKAQYGVKTEWKGVEFPKSSEDMNTVEYGMLIEGAIVEAGEQGIDVRNYKHEWEEYKRNEREKNNARNTGN